MAYRISTLALLLLLGACGSTNSDSSPSLSPAATRGCTDSTAANFNSQANSNDGSCWGGTLEGGLTTNGQASYYGFNTDGTEVTNVSSTPDPTANIVVSNKLYVQINDGPNRELTLAVYEPVCPATSVTFSAVLITDTASTNALTLAVDPSARTTQVTTHSFKTNGVSKERYDDIVQTASTITSCDQGKMIDSEGRTIYMNRSAAIIKDGTSVYLGIAQEDLYSGDPADLNFTPAAYTTINRDNCSLSTCSSPSVGSHPWSLGASGSLSTSSTTVVNGVYRGYLSSFGATNILQATNVESNNSQHFLMKDNTFAIALVANFSSKKLIIGSMPNSSSNCVPDSEAEGYVCSGATGVTFEIEP